MAYVVAPGSLRLEFATLLVVLVLAVVEFVAQRLHLLPEGREDVGPGGVRHVCTAELERFQRFDERNREVLPRPQRDDLPVHKSVPDISLSTHGGRR